METKHSPEPWSLEKGLITGADGLLLTSRMDANAKRIVECVNAFEGIKYPSEFMEVVKKLELDAYKALEKKHADVIELLSTLDHLLSNGNSISPNSVIRTAIQVAVNSNI